MALHELVPTHLSGVLLTPPIPATWGFPNKASSFLPGNLCPSCFLSWNPPSPPSWGSHGLELQDKMQDTDFKVNSRLTMHNFLVLVCPKYCMGHTYSKKLFILYFIYFIWQTHLPPQVTCSVSNRPRTRLLAFCLSGGRE